MTIEEIYIASGAPRRCLGLSYSDLTDVHPKVIQTAKEFVEGFRSYCLDPNRRPKPGFFLLGSESGTAKTAICAVVLQELLKLGKIVGTVRWMQHPKLNMELRGSYSSQEVDEYEIISPFLAADLLVLDDLGAAHSKTASGVSWAQDRLFLIVDSRYSECRPIIGTSNLSVVQLPEIIGKRIMSRLWEMVDFLDLDVVGAKDFRKKTAKARTARRKRA